MTASPDREVDAWLAADIYTLLGELQAAERLLSELAHSVDAVDDVAGWSMADACGAVAQTIRTLGSRLDGIEADA